jgi:hypothetical protein
VRQSCLGTGDINFWHCYVLILLAVVAVLLLILIQRQWLAMTVTAQRQRCVLAYITRVLTYKQSVYRLVLWCNTAEDIRRTCKINARVESKHFGCSRGEVAGRSFTLARVM